jgi:hypothetical protein
MDLAGNILNAIKGKSPKDISYWCGLLIGLALPMIILCVIYSKMVCNNLNALEKYEITNNPYGVQNTTTDSINKGFDIGTLVCCILLIYVLVGTLFTFNFSNNLLNTFLISAIFCGISGFIFILYLFVPFFNTADTGNINSDQKNRDLRLFIDQQDNVSNISSNQNNDRNVNSTYLRTLLIMYVVTIIYLFMKNSTGFISGLLGSSAILILPILWVFNFIIAIKYFYIYPIILIAVRFIRYVIMAVIYIISEKASSFKNGFSDDLVDQLNNFKNYSPSWGLLGIDFLKIIMNVFGYENIFSKTIIGVNNDSKNISDNKFVSSGLLGFVVNLISSGEMNKSGIIYSIVLLVITIIISCTILYGVFKI